MDEYSNIWEIYGLKSDPFNPCPLLVAGGEISKGTFIGREHELEILKTLFRNYGGSRCIVAGDVGVGKTSLVNVARAKAKEIGKFFTPINEIDTQKNWTAEDFVLSTIAAIYNTIERIQEVKISKELKDKLEALVNILNLTEISFSLNVGPLGGGYGKNHFINTPFKISYPILTRTFIELVDEIIKVNGFKEIIIHYNNLENLNEEDLQNLFGGIRDFLLTKNIHFVFVGDSVVFQTLLRINKVASVFTENPIVLENLSPKEIKEILKKRIEEVSIKELKPKIPFEDNVIGILYKLYNGNIRFILNSLSTGLRVLGKDRAVVLSEENLDILPTIAKQRWLEKLNESEKEVLFAILNLKEARNVDISRKIKKKTQNISKVTKKLLSLNAIRIKRKDGRDKFFEVDYQVKWFLLEKPKEELKKVEEKKSIEAQNLLRFLNE